MKNTPVGTFVIGAESRSSCKGKSALSDAQAKGEVMLSEYRHALNDGLGAAEGDAFDSRVCTILATTKKLGLLGWLRSNASICFLAVLIGPSPSMSRFGCWTWPKS